jgi:hypothetical protein
MKQEVALKDQKKKNRTQRNGKLNDISSVDEKNISQSLYLRTVKRQHIYSSMKTQKFYLF